jgi:hypothetical protein
MKKIVLISCGKKKLSHKAKAMDLYISNLFKLSLKYAFSLNPAHIFILSAKYGLLDLEEEIEPYELTLKKMSDQEINLWTERVLLKLKDKVDFRKDEVIFLTGKDYLKNLSPYFSKYQIPLDNLNIFERLHYLKMKTTYAK